MQALKALVIFMGILIVIGIGVVIVTIYQRLGARFAVEEAAPKAELARPAHVAAPAFGAKDVALPAGAVVEEMATSGERLILRLRLEGGGRQILVLDLADGKVLGTLNLETAP
jgi:hypothetical protein